MKHSSKGDFVKKDDLVCKLDDENRTAMLDEALAASKSSQSTV